MFVHVGLTGNRTDKQRRFQRSVVADSRSIHDISTKISRHNGARDGRFGSQLLVEKPCSPNPAEGALLVEAQQKYGKKVQMGTQSRSSSLYIDVINQIHNGLVGRAYFAKAWYSNTRKSIGIGK